MGTTGPHVRSGSAKGGGEQVKTKAGSPQHGATAPPDVQSPDPVMNWNPLAIDKELVVAALLGVAAVDVNVLVDFSMVPVPDS